MKKLKFIVTMLGLIIITTSCHIGRGKRVISVSENNFSLRIEYSGRITFTEDATAIKSISRNGYVKYKMNGKKLEAENRGDKIVYRLYDDEETSTLTDSEKKIVSDAVHEMIKRGHNRN
ncbi:MAG: hypothetical protein JWM28_1064 [Chitinophagaceae bacterium]|nr:hypothetical protein [Chitinophagaceae bacterium]